ncbi:pyrimidine reductase family protein [Corynebacterium mastitidis]|nr:pyrimidine reductase family protein [Corynebacterium mastitidis]MCH6195973.1 pyrimidine reductase family protein [Corynebacterium mastitidis]
MDLDTLLGPTLPLGDAELRAIAISGAVGTASLGGTSGALGNALDASLLQRLRQWSDAVLCAAGTVRSEDYSGVRLSKRAQAERLRESRPPLPPIATLSGSLDLDPRGAFFAEASVPPLIFTAREHSGSARARGFARAGAELFYLDDLTARGVVRRLRALGYPRISCEGGPRLYGDLLAARAIDVFHLTLAPFFGPRVERPLVEGPPGEATRWTLEQAYRHPDSTLFLRYRRAATEKGIKEPGLGTMIG